MTIISQFKIISPKLPCKVICLALSMSCLISPVLVTPLTYGEPLTGDIKLTFDATNIKASPTVPGGNTKISMSFHNMDIPDALRALGRKGGFNVLMDESVTGKISVELNNVTIQDALETLRLSNNLIYEVHGKNLTVTLNTSEQASSLKRSTTQIFPLRYANATVIANILNSTIFSDKISTTGSSGSSGAGGSFGGSGAGGGSGMPSPITVDFHTNSLIVVGQPTDIQAVAEHLKILDKPRESRTWRLSQANVLNVATILASSLFNEGIPTITAGSAGGSSGSSGGGTTTNLQPVTVRAVADVVQEGSGATTTAQAAGSGSGVTNASNSITLRSYAKTPQPIQVSPTGPLIVPDTRLNTLTIFGTAEQIAMAESMIPMLDRKIPQVLLETSLVEVEETGIRQLGYNFGYNNGPFSFGTNNATTTGVATSTATPLENLAQFSTSPLHRSRNFYYQLNALITQKKAKLLANPSIVATSDNEAVVSIVDEIVRSITLTQSALTAPTVTINIGEAGIILNLLPKIGANNTISLRVRPQVSTIASTRQAFGGTITLLSKREVLTQNVQLHDGETFVLGGLVQNSNTSEIYSNPALAKLPIVGALGRSSILNKKRTELIILITPHIVQDGDLGSYSASNPNVGNSNSPSALLSQNYRSQNANASTDRKNALPPLEQTHVLNEANNSKDIADREEKVTKKGPLPSGKVQLSEQATPNKPMPLAQQSTETNIVPVSNTKAATGASTASKPIQWNMKPISQPATEENKPANISDEAIEAIMSKYK